VLSDELYISAQVLLQEQDLPAVIRAAAKQAVARAHTVGSFLQTRTDQDLAELLALGLAARDSAQVRGQLALLAVLLANAEGLTLRTGDDLMLPVRRLLLMVQAEILARRGLVRLPYSALTLERFDPQTLELTEAGQALGVVIRVQRG
jgi:hypothetical protein